MDTTGILVAARMAARRGLHEFACELYEKIINGDDFDDLRERYGEVATAAAIETVRRMPDSKIQNIKNVREISNISLKDGKDLVEAVMEKLSKTALPTTV